MILHNAEFITALVVLMTTRRSIRIFGKMHHVLRHPSEGAHENARSAKKTSEA